MSVYFDRLGLKLARQKQKEQPAPAPAPADTNGLGVAIQQLIDQAVHSQVEAAVEKQRPQHNPRVPAHLREFTNETADTFPPEPPKAKPPMPAVTLQRDRAGKVVTATVGDMTFTIQRDSTGRAIGMTPQG